MTKDDPAHGPISSDHLDAFREHRGDEQTRALGVIHRDCQRWLYRIPLDLTPLQIEDVARHAVADVHHLLAGSTVPIEIVNRRIQTRLGSRRRSEHRKTCHFEPESDRPLVDPETPLDGLLRRESAAWFFRAVRMAKGLVVLTIDHCGQPHASHLIEHVGLEELGLVRDSSVEPLSAKEPAARRQALRRALLRFAESLEWVLLEARVDLQLDQELVEWTRRFLRGEIDDVKPFVVLVEVERLLEESKLELP